MRSVALLAVACVVACGGSSSHDSGDSGSGSTGSDAGQTAEPADAGTGTPSDAGTQQAAPFFLSIQVQGSGTVGSSPAGIDCTASCQAPFNPGASVLLTATPAAGQQFTGWSGACGGTSGCAVTMRRDTSVIANFRALPPMHTLTVLVGPFGRVASYPFGLTCLTGTCAGSFVEGTGVELTPL